MSLDTCTSATPASGITTSQDTRLPELLLLLLLLVDEVSNYSNVIERVQVLESRLLFVIQPRRSQLQQRE